MRLRLTACALSAMMIFGACSNPITRGSIEAGSVFAASLIGLDFVNAASYENEGYYKFVLSGASVYDISELLITVVDSVTAHETVPNHTMRPPHRVAPYKTTLPKPVFVFHDVKSVLGAERDSLEKTSFILTYRGEVRVRFVAWQQSGGVVIAILPHEPENGAFLGIRQDQLQRNAVEKLHEAFMTAAIERLDIRDVTPE